MECATASTRANQCPGYKLLAPSVQWTAAMACAVFPIESSR